MNCRHTMDGDWWRSSNRSLQHFLIEIVLMDKGELDADTYGIH